MKTEINKINILVIIPCFNEQASIYAILNEIESLSISGTNIVALPVNDCSKDKTLSEIKKVTNTYLDLPINLGIGGAVQSGYKYAQKYNYDIAIQLDGDGQHPVNEIEKLIIPIINTESDIVIGSRFINKQGFQSSSLRRFGINYFKKLNQLLLGIKITDSTSGFRAINKKAIDLVCNYYPDEYPEPEAIVLFKLNNLKISEIPVTMSERKGGQSSISSYKTIYYMIKVSLGIIFIYLRIKFYGKRNTL